MSSWFHNKYFIEYDHVVMDCIVNLLPQRNVKNMKKIVSYIKWKYYVFIIMHSDTGMCMNFTLNTLCFSGIAMHGQSEIHESVIIV